MGALGVVDDDERVVKGLKFGDCFWLGLLFEPAFQGLLEPFDFAAGGGMVRSTVFLFDAVCSEFGFERGVSSSSGRESDGVDRAVICQC